MSVDGQTGVLYKSHTNRGRWGRGTLWVVTAAPACQTPQKCSSQQHSRVHIFYPKTRTSKLYFPHQCKTRYWNNVDTYISLYLASAPRATAMARPRLSATTVCTCSQCTHSRAQSITPRGELITTECQPGYECRSAQFRIIVMTINSVFNSFAIFRIPKEMFLE